MLEQMDAAANVVPPTKQEAKKKAPKEKKVLVEGVEEAIASALTKFDAMEAFFAAGKRGEIAKLLQDEVTADLLGAEGAKGRRASRRPSSWARRCSARWARRSASGRRA